MMLPRTFSPAGKITLVEETSEDRLKKLARAILPRFNDDNDEQGKRKRRGGKHMRRNGPRYCDCGERLYGMPKIRQGRAVCDECALLIPRASGGRKKPKKD